jgi:FkbM family methyltransferase
MLSRLRVSRLWACLLYLNNGFSIWLRVRFKWPLPPFHFRNGMVWHHGKHDDPILLLREIYIENFYEPLNAPPGATVLDIGANIGAVTMFWARERPDTHFHAYEPNPQAYGSLRQNITFNALSERVTIHPEAIGGKRGRLDLWTDVPTVLSTAYGDAPKAGGKKLSVPMITLDDAWDRIGRTPIWMLKIDVEGAEGDILEATSDELLANVSTAFVEWHDDIVPGVRIRCIERLREAGFRVRERVHPWDQGILFVDRVSQGIN